MRYRIALCGFSEFEYRAMHFSFQHPADGEAGYDVVDAIGEADFTVVDSDSKPAVKGIVLSGRVGKSVFVGVLAPPGAGVIVPRPIDPARILRALADLAARHASPPPGEPIVRYLDDEDLITLTDPPLLTDAVPLATEPGVFVPDPIFITPAPAPAHTRALDPEPEPEREPEPPPPTVAPAAAKSKALSPEAEARSAAKAAARAAARRARITHSNSGPGQLDQVTDVLVLDADEHTSAQLTGLLQLFGFRVHLARDIAQAADVLARRPLAAAFLDITLDGHDEGDGVALLQTIQDLPRLVGHPAPPVLTVSAQLNAADRVRAALAGIKPLTKPVTRGDVARALEACNVTLPADARRV